MPYQSSRAGRVTLADAEAVAAQAFAHLAGEPALLVAFLGATGLELDDVRERAGTREFLGAVLDYVVRDESLLIVFAAQAGHLPETVARAAHVLAGDVPG